MRCPVANERQNASHDGVGSADPRDTIEVPADLAAKFGLPEADHPPQPPAPDDFKELTPREFVEYLASVRPPYPVDGLDELTIAEIAALGEPDEPDSGGRVIEYHYHVHVRGKGAVVNIHPETDSD